VAAVAGLAKTVVGFSCFVGGNTWPVAYYAAPVAYSRRLAGNPLQAVVKYGLSVGRYGRWVFYYTAPRSHSLLYEANNRLCVAESPRSGFAFRLLVAYSRLPVGDYQYAVVACRCCVVVHR
jgi:hypothetical protein